jgi:hypothetical protein
LNGAVPETLTANIAVCPAVTVLFAGWLVIKGGALVPVGVVVVVAVVPVPERNTTYFVPL